MQRQVKAPHENLAIVANYHCMQLKYIARIAFHSIWPKQLLASLQTL